MEGGGNPSDSGYITIGKVLKPVGLAGEVKVLPLTSFLDRFRSLKQVRILIGQNAQRVDVRAVRYDSRFVFFSLGGVDSPEAADGLRGGFLQVPEAERHPLPAGSFYQYELIGLSVLTETGVPVGQVSEVIETGGNDVYMVRSDAGEYGIPALASVVRKIDLAGRQMIIRPIPGLLPDRICRPAVPSTQPEADPQHLRVTRDV